jgi:Folded gastrulation N-terminus
MKRIKAVITLLTLFLAHGATLPVTSKALENNADQLIWQTAWYSQYISGEGDKESPFTGGDRKITAKSIFITPNLHAQEASHCPPGYKIDEKGKCIKIVNVNQGK